MGKDTSEILVIALNNNDKPERQVQVLEASGTGRPPSGKQAWVLEQAERHTDAQLVKCPKARGLGRRGPVSRVTHWSAVLASAAWSLWMEPCRAGLPAGPGPGSLLADGVRLPPLRHGHF